MALPGPAKPGHSPHKQIVLGVDNIDAQIRTVGKIKSLRSGIDPGNIGTDQRITGNRDNSEKFKRSFSIRPVGLTILRRVARNAQN